MADCRIRTAVAADAPALLASMRGLARFEGYDDRFAVTEADLLARGLAPESPREFVAFVADGAAAGLQGHAVVLEIPFTFDLRPTLVLKELFVAQAARGSGVGRALFDRVLAHGRERGAGRLHWRVLPGNDAAKAFYARAGGGPEPGWEHWEIRSPGT